MTHRWLAILFATVIGVAGFDTRADDVAAGRTLFEDKCERCHGLIDERRVGMWPRGRVIPAVALPLGPNLTGIYGRPAGTIAGFRYSDAFKAIAPDLVWNDETLELWLADSQTMIRGSYMFIKVTQPGRRQVIEYLKSFSRYQN